MENKLITALKSFSSAQLRSLRDFVLSPYFNKNETLSNLLLFLMEQIQSELPITDEVLFSHLFPNELFDKTKISKIRYKAFILVEKFIQQQLLKNKPIESLILLLEYYTDHNLTDEFNAIYGKLNEQQSIDNQRNSDYYYLKFLIEEAASRRVTQNQERHQPPHYEKVEENLNIFFIARKLELVCHALSRSKVVTVAFEPDLLPDVIRHIESNLDILQHPAINVYYHLYLMLKEPENTAYFYDFQQIINENEGFFSAKERKNFHAYLQNYCIAKINTADKEFEYILFQLYDQHLQNGSLFTEKGELLHTSFKNIVILALRLKELKWSEDFLEKYKNYLPENTRQDTYQYCLAKLYFTQKQYQKVLTCLHTADFQDVFQNISARRLTMLTYYELQEWAALEAMLNSFRVFLHRNQTIAETHKISYRNFANFLKKLYELPPNRPDLWQKLSQNLQKTAAVSEKKWLLEKLEEKNLSEKSL
ncbi:MAG: hypothetical protein ACKVTZ_12450 [Bacteroidia bacterium]